jgi:hypothetical protein
VLSVLALLLLAGVGAVLWSKNHSPPDTQMVRGDMPLRLLEWGVGLLRADRIDWGQAMLGELDRIEVRSARWRFALGCVAGILVHPPDGVVGAMAGFAAAALGGAVVLGLGFVHFGLAANPWNWMSLAIMAALLVSLVVAASVLLRRRGVVGPGLLGGLFVATAWLACSRLTLLGLTDPIHQIGRLSVPILLIAVPLIVGAVGAWQSRNAHVGRRIARLAGISAGLAMFFVSTIAVLAIDGGPRDPGVGVAGGVSEALFLAAMLFLVFLPLATATIGWIAATATDRFRSVRLARRNDDATSAPALAGRVVVGAKSRSVGPLLLRAAVVVVIVMAAALLYLAR